MRIHRSAPWLVGAALVTVCFSLATVRLGYRYLSQAAPERLTHAIEPILQRSPVLGEAAQKAGCLQQSALVFTLSVVGQTHTSLTLSERTLALGRASGHLPCELLARTSRLVAVSSAGHLGLAIEESRELEALVQGPRFEGLRSALRFHRASWLKQLGRHEEATRELERIHAKDHAGGISRDHLTGDLARWASSSFLPVFYELARSPRAARSLRSDARPQDSGWPGAAAAQAMIDRVVGVDPAIRSRYPRLKAHQSSKKAATPATAARLGPRLQCRLGEEELVPLERASDVPTRGSLWRQALALSTFVAGRHEQANTLNQEQARLDLRASSPLDAALSLLASSRSLWYLGRFDEAIERAGAAVACFEVDRQRYSSLPLAEAHSGGARRVFHQTLIEMLSLEGRHGEALEIAERARSSAFLRSLEASEGDPDSAHSTHLDAEIKRVALLIREQELEPLRSPEADRELVNLRHRLEGLLTRQALDGSNVLAEGGERSLELEEIQAALGPDVTLVSYFATDLSLQAWVVEQGRFSSFSLPSLASDPTAVPCFADFVRRSRSGERLKPDCEDGQTLAEKLYQRLIAPLRPAIHHQRWVVVPHASLHFIPFGALRNPVDGRALIEDVTLTYAPSFGALHLLRGAESPLKGRTLVLGDPHSDLPGLGPLAGARREVETLAKLLNTSPRLGAGASEEALEAALREGDGEIDLVHIAAHGVFLPESPRLSYLALARTASQDGQLEVHEIYRRLDFHGVNLVVLSACETALGERTEGDEVVGLTRAFLAAGATGVVSTLWRVDDTASTDLMSAFYHHLNQGKTAAEALRQAQLMMMKRPGPEQGPYFWAGFVLTGDPRARWGTAPR